MSEDWLQKKKERLATGVSTRELIPLSGEFGEETKEHGRCGLYFDSRRNFSTSEEIRAPKGEREEANEFTAQIGIPTSELTTPPKQGKRKKDRAAQPTAAVSASPRPSQQPPSYPPRCA